jgi:hypothetical protein
MSKWDTWPGKGVSKPTVALEELRSVSWWLLRNAQPWAENQVD